MRPAMIPYTNTPRNGNPDLYLAEIPKTDPIDQRMNTTKRIFKEIGIGFQPFAFPIPGNYCAKYIKFALIAFFGIFKN